MAIASGFFDRMPRNANGTNQLVNAMPVHSGRSKSVFKPRPLGGAANEPRHSNIWRCARQHPQWPRSRAWEWLMTRTMLPAGAHAPMTANSLGHSQSHIARKVAAEMPGSWIAPDQIKIGSGPARRSALCRHAQHQTGISPALACLRQAWLPFVGVKI